MLRTGNLDENKFAQVNKNVPVVGYCGFLKGVKAENVYGLTYEQLARTSNRNWKGDYITEDDFLVKNLFNILDYNCK